MGKVVAVVCYIGGALVLFLGMVFMAIAFTVPMAVGGSLLIFGLLIAFIGMVLIYLGDRSYRKNQVHIQGWVSCGIISQSKSQMYLVNAWWKLLITIFDRGFQIKPQENETTWHQDTRVASMALSYGLYIITLKNYKRFLRQYTITYFLLVLYS